MYEDFAKSRAKKSVVDSLQEEQPAASSNVHIFQVCVSVLCYLNCLLSWVLYITKYSVNADGYNAVSYTHLTLPTNREV